MYRTIRIVIGISSLCLVKLSFTQTRFHAYAFSTTSRSKICDSHTIRSWRTILTATSSSSFGCFDEENVPVSNTNSTSTGSNASQDEKSPNRLHAKESVVSRLKQAAIRASAAAAMEQQQENIQMKNTFFSSHSPLTSEIEKMKNTKPVVTLRQLTAAIDSQLHRARAVPWDQYQTHMMYQNQQQRFHNHRHQISALPRDSMAAIITHNYQHQVSSKGSLFRTPTITHEPNINMTTTTAQRITAEMSIATIRHVAIIFMKKSMLVDSHRVLTVECAGRIQRLVHAIRREGYKPNVVIFVGESHTTIIDQRAPSASPICHDELPVNSDADLGYVYFMNSMNHAQASSNNMDLNNIWFHIERSKTSLNSLANIATYIQQEHVVQWLDAAVIEAEAAAMKMAAVRQTSSNPTQQQQRRWKVHIQFALISSDYHLCILNDIHVRSPGQSPLRALDRWSLSSIVKNTTTVATNSSNRPSNLFSGIQLDTSWIYMYSTTINLHRSFSESGNDEMDIYNDSNIAIASFSSICYHRAQDLIPVLYNLRGVVANEEFFQRENYRALVQARRQLVSGMEQLYRQQPSLAVIHKVLTPLESSHNIPTSTQSTAIESDSMVHQWNGKPLDVVLEGALLSLGRCLDLVRPAGLLTGSVPAHDFKLAVMILNQALTQISIACDPDRPLIMQSVSIAAETVSKDI
jgi:hypothetical protein